MIKRLLVLGIALSALVPPIAQATNVNRFEFVLHDGLIVQDVAHLDAALNEAYDDVLSRLGLESLPKIIVEIWKDETAYQAAMEASIGARAPGSRGYAYGAQHLRLLYHELASARREAVHEFAHVATLNINPDFGNNPRWLWEAVAIYLAGEFVDPTSSGIFQGGRCPSLESMSAPFSEGGEIYAAGYVLIEFIEQNWGFESVIELIESEGALDPVTGIDVSEFERRWCKFVQEAYLFESS